MTISVWQGRHDDDIWKDIYLLSFNMHVNVYDVKIDRKPDMKVKASDSLWALKRNVEI